MKYSIAFIFFYSSLTVGVIAQTKTAGNPSGVSNQQNNSHFEERIYLHINASFLLVGESLLFKAYCLNSTSHTPSKLSTIAYVEVIDEQASPVLQAKVLLAEGNGSGDFFLPSTLTSGNYTVIAYTHWMKNYSVHNFFRTQITIINPFRKPDTATQKKKSNLQIEFFPEGGKLIAGLNNTVAFSVVDENKKSAKFTGKVLDEAGNNVVEFSPTHNGIGKFTLTPASGKEYKAVIIDSLQNIYFQPLPVALADGIAMHITEKENAFQIDLASQGIGKNVRAKIIAHQGESRFFETAIQFNTEQAQLEIKKESLPFGISQLTILHSNNDVACERFIFNTPIYSERLNLTFDKKKYQTRQKVNAVMVSKDTSVTQVSISVRKIETKINHSSTLSNYLFPGDEKSKLNTAKRNTMDDQMLVRKATAYSLENLLDNKSFVPKFLPEIRSNLITGTVRSKDNSPVAKEKVYLSIPSKNYLFFASLTDSAGRFYFNTDEIKFNTDIIFQVSPKTCLDCQIKMDDNGLDDYANFVPEPLAIDTSFRKVIEQRSILAQIENAYYSQKQDSILDVPESTRFYGQPDKTYLLDDYVRFPTIEDILIEYVLEIILRKKGNEFEIRVMNLRKREAFGEEPLILLDGIPIFDINQIMNYNPLQLKKIEIVGRRYFYGPIETQGIISFTTYDGLGKNILISQKEKYLGILPAKSYFAPKYNEASSSLATIPDYRNQLYWNPDITLSDKPYSFEFYTSDVAGDFEIIIEGIREDGLPVQYRETIHVDAK